MHWVYFVAEKGTTWTYNSFCPSLHKPFTKTVKPKFKICTVCKITPKKSEQLIFLYINVSICPFSILSPTNPCFHAHLPLPHNPHIVALHKVRFKLCEVVLCEKMSHQCDYSLLDILSFSMFNLTWCGLNLSSCKIAFWISHGKNSQKI